MCPVVGIGALAGLAAVVGDAEGAESNLLRGLALDPGHVPTMEALTKQYSDRGDWLKAAQMMVRAESYTPVVLDKVRSDPSMARITHLPFFDGSERKLYTFTLSAESVPAVTPNGNAQRRLASS